VKIHQVTGQAAVAVLTSADFDVLAFGPAHAKLATRLGVDLSAVMQMMDYQPLALRGEAHRQARLHAARVLAAGQGAAMALVPVLAGDMAQVLQTPGRHEVMAGVVVPMTDALLGALVGVALDAPGDAMLSRIFSKTIGIGKRRRMNAEMQALLARVRQTFPDEDAALHGARVAMGVLGRDSTIGSIGLSLHDWLMECSGIIGDRPFAPYPTRTGVPVVSRQALRDTTVGGCPVSAGGIVDCDMTHAEAGDSADAARFFGSGAHACLGRRLTLALFAEMSKALCGVTTRVEKVEMTMRRDDIFAIPETLWVTVQA
jgi:hypothetical protein